MQPAFRLGVFAVLSVGALAAGMAWSTRRDAPAAHAGDPTPAPIAPAARLGVVHGAVDGLSAEVALANIDPTARVAKLATLGVVTHKLGSTWRGALLGDTAFVVASEDTPLRNSSYDGALFRVEAGKATRLTGDIMRAATPYVTKTGRVIVARGSDGAEPTVAESKQLIFRTDDLSIDDVDPVTGTTRTLWQGRGYQAFLATTIAQTGELVVQHLTKDGATLFALDPATGATRTLLPSVPPLARDFSWDATHKAVVFAAFVPGGYGVYALDVSGGTLRVVHSTANEHAMPFALTTGEVALSSDGDHGLALLVPGGSNVGGALSSAGGPRHRLLAPLGDGSDAATHASFDGRWLAVRHTPAVLGAPLTDSRPPTVFAFDVATGTAITLDVPVTHYVVPMGFVSTPGGAS